MMNSETQNVDLGDGGVITVLLSKNVGCPPEYATHPRVYVVDATSLGPQDVAKAFPSNGKILITTQGLPQSFYHRLQTELRHRTNILTLYRPTEGSVKNELDKRLKRDDASKLVNNAGEVVAAKTNGNGTALATQKHGNAPKGSIGALVAELDDPSRSISEEGRRLFKIAQERGIPTTIGSVTQGVSKHRRTHGLGARPASAVPREVNKRLAALRVLDDAIAGLALVREYVETTEAENIELKAKLDKARAAFAQLAS
jgi:hypothetical protein